MTKDSKVRKIHYCNRSSVITACNLEAFYGDTKISSNLKEVTCGNCLRISNRHLQIGRKACSKVK